MGKLLFTAFLLIALPALAVTLAGLGWILVYLGVIPLVALGVSMVTGVWLVGIEVDRNAEDRARG